MNILDTIPRDLFPIKENEYNFEWAKKTYLYAHMFSLSSDHQVYPTDDQINMWRSKAIQIKVELNNIGKEKGVNKILELANFHYNFKIKDTELPCQSIQDVLNIVADKTWYNNHKAVRLNQIYMMVYGITRQGFDQWLVDLELYWLKKNNVTYAGKSGHQDILLNCRGSVYSLLKKVFNNNIIKQFKNTMWYNHDEFICVRMKHQKFGQDELIVKRINCRWGQVYLCSKKKDLCQETSHECTESYALSGDTLCDVGRDWVEKSLQKGIKYDELQNLVKRWSTSYFEKHKSTLLLNGMYLRIM